jgi:L-alanine-DL-glutamate epimerase-like enolase superfamily enzyme
MNEAFTGINIKLMKSTGLREALKMIHYCKKNNIQVMLGCMAESSCATTAMAHLAGMADFVDLDAPLLYTNDPFEGLSYEDGFLLLPKENGMGFRLKSQLWSS